MVGMKSAGPSIERLIQRNCRYITAYFLCFIISCWSPPRNQFFTWQISRKNIMSRMTRCLAPKFFILHVTFSDRWHFPLVTSASFNHDVSFTHAFDKTPRFSSPWVYLFLLSGSRWCFDGILHKIKIYLCVILNLAFNITNWLTLWLAVQATDQSFNFLQREWPWPPIARGLTAPHHPSSDWRSCNRSVNSDRLWIVHSSSKVLDLTTGSTLWMVHSVLSKEETILPR